MTGTTTLTRRVLVSGLAGCALGFGIAAGVLLGPIGWIAAVVLLAVLTWLLIRTAKESSRLARIVGIAAVVGVALYTGLGLAQNLFDAPPSDSGEGTTRG